jgi:signal transduction histidine kinase
VVANNFSEYLGHLPQLALPSSRSEAAIPLIAGDQLLGVFDLQSDVENSFGEDEIRIHTTLAAQVAVALQNAILYAEQLETTERLREVDRLKSEFLASMSHELRTPLNSIIGFADVLLEGIDGQLNERMVEDVTLIRDSGRHLRSLIGEMLDMSKIEAGVMELYYEKIDVPALAEEIIANAQSLAKDKDLVFDLQIDPELQIIEADRTRLMQILLNLISNAIKFTEKGEITLSMSQNNGELVASVQDTGIGIEQDDIPKIFEQFRQVDGSPTRKAGGAGLGIPISKSLVELHGGKMWVESVPGIGSTFSFTIPAQKID